MNFKCPKCGGPYCGRPNAIDRPELMACHCTKDGGHINAMPGKPVTPKEEYCGWVGTDAECGLHYAWMDQGEQLRANREALDFSLKDAAFLLGMQREELANMERGAIKPDMTILERLL